MSTVLDKFLRKIGAKSYLDLNDEEKETFKTWEQSLSGRRLTDEEVREFLDRELNEAIVRLTEVDLSKESEIFRKVEVRFIKKILTFLDMPLVEKQMLEQNIEKLIQA